MSGTGARDGCRAGRNGCRIAAPRVPKAWRAKFGPDGGGKSRSSSFNTAALKRSSAAARLSRTCASLAALGIALTPGCVEQPRQRNLSRA